MTTYDHPSSLPMTNDDWLKIFIKHFPEWSVFRSDTGRWWATLRRQLTSTEIHEGVPRTVDADRPRQLADTLTRQGHEQGAA